MSHHNLDSRLSLPESWQSNHSSSSYHERIEKSHQIVKNWLQQTNMTRKRLTSPRPTSQGHPISTRQTEPWRRWAEVKIQLCDVPPPLRQTLRIYNLLKTYGDISKIDIAAKRSGGGYHAYVLFQPPPKEDFWSRVFRVSLQGRAYRLQFRILSEYTPNLVKSPIDPTVQYPKLMTLAVSNMDFGFMIQENKMMQMMQIESCLGQEVEFLLNLKRKEIDISFPLRMSNQTAHTPLNIQQYRLRVRFAHLNKIYEFSESESSHVFLIPLQSPPEYFKKTTDVASTHDEKESCWTEWRTWKRQTETRLDDGLDQQRATSIRFRKEHPVIDFGRWLTYRLVFDLSKNCYNTFALIRRALQDHNVHITEVDNYKIHTTPHVETKVWEFLDVQPREDNLSALADMASGFKHLSFSVRYQLEVCLSRGYLNEYNMNEKFLKAISEVEENKALDILERVADLKRRLYNPMEIFSMTIPRNVARRSNIPGYCCLSRTAIVTPTTIHYSTPQMEISNRVIRQYNEYGDRFLRVKFSDELLLGRLHSQSDDSYEDVYTRITGAMRHGITVGDRHYEFLAFGNSQFREHSAYFFASLPALSAANIRSQLGDLSDIRVAAKWCARLGQNFSTTRAIRTKVKVCDTLDDVVRNGYNFTDGIGKISSFLSTMIAVEIGLPNAYFDSPSVFQFRLSGCKGVLAIDPDIKMDEIHIRESQYKFPARLMGLEIIRSSQFVTATLNRQIIVLLSALGVPDQVFRTMLKNMLCDLESAMTQRDIALRMLQKNIDFNRTTLTMAGMILDGFLQVREPFMLSLLKLWRSWSIKYLKEKAKISVGEGACLLGCVDEKGVLKGHFNKDWKVGMTKHQMQDALPEIFLRVDPDGKGHYYTITGTCILARNPSLHPGDVRVVKAVDKSELYHLKNVVVLPQTGDRDLANMCSGGDLDGDDYLVIWDQSLIPPEQAWNIPAMNFTPNKPTELDRNVTVDDITDFFVQYIKNDQLGAIAHAHLAFADYEQDSVKNEKCIALAALHSCAVDYPKSGVPAVIPRHLRPKKWPHFMEKKFKRPEDVYVSKKVLGQLYDQVERVSFVPEWTNFDSRILHAFELDDEMLERAKSLKMEYDAAMRRIMAQHGIATEFEVWSTFVLEHNQEKKDYTFTEELGHLANALKERFRKACSQAAGDSTQLDRLIVAMYTVTAHEVRDALASARDRIEYTGRTKNDAANSTAMPLMSFPWIFEKDLGKIALGKQQTLNPSAPLESRLQRQRHYPVEKEESSPDTIVVRDEVVHQGELLMLFDDAPACQAEETKTSSDSGDNRNWSKDPSNTIQRQSEEERVPGCQVVSITPSTSPHSSDRDRELLAPTPICEDEDLLQFDFEDESDPASMNSRVDVRTSLDAKCSLRNSGGPPELRKHSQNENETVKSGTTAEEQLTSIDRLMDLMGFNSLC